MLGSLLTMPIIVLNMGGEMIYILHQRLQAQNVPDEKARKVLEDVVKTMYTTVFLEELFKPQEIYSAASTKQIFEKLAHSSIMRLNKTSMDKLYDLMTMGVKYQLIACKSPQQYLQVTLNHLDSLIDLVKSESVTELIHIAISKAIEMYSALSNGNWLLLQQELYKFYQGKKIKVSLFLQQNLQTLTGTLVLTNHGSLPYGTELPGQIRYYEDGRMFRSEAFRSEIVDKCFECNEVLDSSSRLGMNMYLKSPLDLAAGLTSGASFLVSSGDAKGNSVSLSSQEASRAFADRAASLMNGGSSSAGSKTPSKSTKYSQFSAKAELTMLSDLLGLGSPAKGDKASSSADNKPFKINLFSNAGWSAKPGSSSGAGGGDDSEDEYDGASGGVLTIDIDARAGAKTVDRYMRELDLGGGAETKGGGGGGGAAQSKGGSAEEEDDLLALMDSAK